MNEENRAGEIAASIPMLQHLGIRHVESGERHAVMTVTVAEQHRNYMGGAHGGLLATLADTACFFATPLLPSGVSCATVSMTLNYIHAAMPGDRLRAKAAIDRLGRRTVHLSITIKRDDGLLIARGSAVLAKLTADVSTSG